MSIPKENRQQMINLMYLVLTALLALNVSAEILKAFQTINSSLENSNSIADNNIKTTYKGFADKLLKEPTNQQALKFQALATQVLKMSDDLVADIRKVKGDLITQAGGPGEDGALIKRMDDIDVSTRFLVEGPNKAKAKGGEGYMLESKINSTLAQYMSMVDTAFKSKIAAQINLSTKSTTKGKDWVNEQFYEMPAIASYTMLTKIENDAKSAENTMIRYLFSMIGSTQDLKAEDIVLNQFSAQVSSPSAYVLQGEPFEANISLAASSADASVSVSVNGQPLPVKDGVGAYRVTASGIGDHSLVGVVSVKNNRTGVVTPYKTEEFKYTVAAPFAAVSPTKMNVFYIGVENPVAVSAAGVAANKLQVSIDQGSITGSNGVYGVNVTTQSQKDLVHVSANGKHYGDFPFRVKLIPNPIAKVNNQPGGPINTAVWKAQKGVIADLENFEFDAKFTVLSFNMFFQPRLRDPGIASATGPYFSAAMQQFITQAKPGDLFYLEDIKVKGPDGLSRKIPGVTFKMQ